MIEPWEEGCVSRTQCYRRVARCNRTRVCAAQRIQRAKAPHADSPPGQSSSRHTIPSARQSSTEWSARSSAWGAPQAGFGNFATEPFYRRNFPRELSVSRVPESDEKRPQTHPITGIMMLSTIVLSLFVTPTVGFTMMPPVRSVTARSTLVPVMSDVFVPSAAVDGLVLCGTCLTKTLASLPRVRIHLRLYRTSLGLSMSVVVLFSSIHSRASTAAAGVALILMQDVATNLISEPRITLDDVHFGPGSEATTVEDIAYSQVADLLQGDGLPLPEVRTRIQDTYSDVQETLAEKNTKKL